MKIAVGLSGGVDSSVSAHLLKEAGHDVTGVYLECWRAPGCRAEEDRKDALSVALDLGIPFRSLDFRKEYRDRVVEIFFEDYRRGLTPNPDVWCNTEIKFGLFYSWAMAQGFDAIATGHYAQVLQADDILTLSRSKDEKKDQTYFLYRTRQDQLSHVLFPIGHLTKDEVRVEAQKRNILVAGKPDSQGICFIGDINVHDFLKEHLGEKPGDVLDVEGNVIGSHKGHWFYTIGQRHGFTLLPAIYKKDKTWKHVLPPLYVISKDAQTNTIVVGFGVETVADTVPVSDIFVRQDIFSEEKTPLFVRVRHGGKLLPAQFSWTNKEAGQGTIFFEEAQRGLAPGQSIVWYDASTGETCFGGSVIAA
jgi:tRNA-specific 2-thiouridylase